MIANQSAFVRYICLCPYHFVKANILPEIMRKNPKVNVYEISMQLRVLDKTIIPQIVVDKEPVLLVAHIALLRAGESKRGANRWFAFQQQRGLPYNDAHLYVQLDGIY